VGYQPAAAYGLGVQLVQVAGHPALGHSGRFLGARAVVRWLPDLQVAVAVLTNQSRSDPSPILADLLKLALRPQSDCITCPALP
jgi:CubicO group peptidase (beta-lactamase class C family)